MTRLIFCLILAVCASAPAQPSAARPAASGASTTADVIQRKDGTKVFGTVVRRTATTVEVRSKMAGGAIATVTLPISTIARIEFAASARTDDQLARMGTPELLQLWKAESPFLDLPESPAGSVGLEAVRRLIDDTPSRDPKMAGQMLGQITAKDWNVAHRAQAKALTLGVLRIDGKYDELKRSHGEIVSSDAPSEIKAEASYYLALALIDRYRDFLKNNPRWDSDPLMRPKHDQLYNEVLDNLLAPYLRYGAPSAVSARSLLVAVNFLQENGSDTEAKALAGDLTTVFATQPEAETARKFLEKK